MFKHTAQCTSLDYVEETLSYLVIKGWCTIYSTHDFNLLSSTDVQQSTHSTHLTQLNSIQEDLIIFPVSQ